MRTFGSVLTAIAMVVYLAAGPASRANAAGDADVLARSIELYPTLKSYADSGVVLSEFAPSSSYTHTFKTYFKAPRQFLFEFNADVRSGGRRIVIWCDGGDFQSWDSSLGIHNTYARGSDTTVAAFGAVSSTTGGAVGMIPSLIFAGSGLVATVGELHEYSVEKTEDIGGRPAHKVVGVARSSYPRTQRETNVRRAAVWIDSETRLVRKVFDDTAVGLPTWAVNRTTITYDSQANPALDDARFRFTVPSTPK
jgi:outer membrane lipoprotein-sorting protein